MKKLILFISFLLIASTVSAAPPERQFSYTDGTTIRSAEVTANEDEIYEYLGVGVDNIRSGGIDAIGEFSSALRSGSDNTLITGTEGSNTQFGIWNSDGDLVGVSGITGTTTGVGFPALRVTDLVSCDTIDTNASGVLSCGTDDSGGGDLSSTDIDTYSELNTIVADVTLAHNGLIDTYSELNAIVADVTLTHNGLIDTFAELDAIVADKALFNKADGGTVSADVIMSGLVVRADIDEVPFKITGFASQENRLFTVETGEGADVLTGTTTKVYAGVPFEFDDVAVFFSDPAPTTSTAGECAFDSNAWASGRGAVQCFDGTAAVYMPGVVVSDTPSNGDTLKWSTGGIISWEEDLNTAGITGTDTQVVFFDGNDNPVGDSGLTYNKTTNALSAGSFIAAPSPDPKTEFIDSDGEDGDVSANIVTNLTTTGTTVEVTDVIFSGQVAGVMTAFITRDGSVPSTTVADFVAVAPNLQGAIDYVGTAVNDDDCTGQQGEAWWDSTDSAFEWCNADSGTPSVLGGGSFDSTTVDATTWSDGANASNAHTYDVSGTDTTTTYGSANHLLSSTGEMQLRVQSTQASSDSNAPALRLQQDDGAALGNAHTLGYLFFSAAKNASNTIASGASIEAYATELWDATGTGTKLLFTTAPNDSTTRTIALTIHQDQSIETAGAVELGHATDTTVARTAAGRINVEGKDVCLDDGTDCPASSGGITNLTLPVQSAKLTGTFAVAGDASQGAQIDAGEGAWRLLFDATTDEGAVWQFIMPDNYASAPTLKVHFSMASGEANEVEFEGSIMCYTTGTDTADVATASFAAVDAGTPTTVSATAGEVYQQSITLTDDSCAAGDMVWIQLSTDADDATNDDATGDREVIGVEFSYTGS